ncbi:galactokinase [candidate division KSB1 bacterium]|nr:galactokinase [candidate division KSB1 bacterium]
MSEKSILEKFNAKFPGKPRVFAAPGRVNLIGEHTDYNDGFVFPMALDRYTFVAIAATNDRKLTVFSVNMDETMKIDLDNNTEKRSHWSDYVSGMAFVLEEKGYRIPGADILLESDVPVGSGLSSSAALEMSSGLAFLGIMNQTMPKADLALLGQRAENKFVGMNCGIMDQFISMHGRKDHALFLDCRSLDYQLVPLPSDNVRIVICNTMVKHELGSSEYNKRRAECEKGVEIMSKDFPGIKALRDVSLDQFESVESQLPDVVRRRCRHVISEDDRTLASIEALQSNDLVCFGKLMNASHDSLRDDYQVSCKELDTMVDIARTIPGVLGARMTGGGFGGCTVNLVNAMQVENFCMTISSRYFQVTGLEPKIYVSVPSDGGHEIGV